MNNSNVEELTSILYEQVCAAHERAVNLSGLQPGTDEAPLPYLQEECIVIVPAWDDNGVPTGVCAFWIDFSDDNVILRGRGHYGQPGETRIIGGGNLTFINEMLEF